MSIKATHLHTKSLLAAAALGLASLATTAHAQPITDSFNYQGELIDSGAPANGLYDITFVIYDTPVGGAPLITGTQTVNDVQVTDGRFEAFVDFAGSGALFDSDQTRWLELRVSLADTPGFTTLEPRQRLGPVPVASYALRSGSAVFAENTNASLQDAYDNGSTIFRGAGDDAVVIRSQEGLSARLNLGNGFGGEGPGQFAMYTETGGLMFTIEEDLSLGGGGFLQISNSNEGNPGLIIDGNVNGSQSTRLRLFGNSGTITFDTSLLEDSSVQLPFNSISSFETVNETGLAEAENPSFVALTDVASTVDIVDTVAINPPSVGYVFVIASVELTISHVSGFSSGVNLGVSSNSSTIPSNGDHETRIPSITPTGSYDFAVTTHAVFAVNEGITNFNLLGDKNNTSGTAIVSDIQLTAIFIPSAYGSASIQGSELTNILPDELAPITLPMTDYDILLERNAALEANDARIQKEMEEMKAQMQRVLEQTERILSEQSQD